jgi:hypothetical protein
MKLKGLSKIAIAGAALAATAATLGTSTYAWYVSNDNVAMDGVTGATAGTEVGSNLIIAGNLVTADGDAPSIYGPSVSLTAAGDRTAYEKTDGTSDSLFLAEALNPQSAEDITASTIAWKNADGTANNTPRFIEFKVWVKNSKDATIVPEFGIENATTDANLKTQTAYNPQGLPTKKAGADTAVKSGDSFTVDAIQALRMEITKKSAVTYSTPETEIYKVAEMAKTTALNGTYTTDATKFATGGDANLYYKNMKNAVAYNTTADTGVSKDVSGAVYSGEKEAWSNFAVKADEDVLVSFRIWLEGADKDCWDSCINQTFNFNLKFTVYKEQNNQQTNP